jgi:hypothetical protein
VGETYPAWLLNVDPVIYGTDSNLPFWFGVDAEGDSLVGAAKPSWYIELPVYKW